MYYEQHKAPCSIWIKYISDNDYNINQIPELKVVLLGSSGVGKTGFVVPPGVSLPLANAIEIISKDLSLSKEMGLAARAHYEKNFTGLKMGQEYSNLYNNL